MRVCRGETEAIEDRAGGDRRERCDLPQSEQCQFVEDERIERQHLEWLGREECALRLRRFELAKLTGIRLRREQSGGKRTRREPGGKRLADEHEGPMRHHAWCTEQSRRATQVAAECALVEHDDYRQKTGEQPVSPRDRLLRHIGRDDREDQLTASSRNSPRPSSTSARGGSANGAKARVATCESCSRDASERQPMSRPDARSQSRCRSLRWGMATRAKGWSARTRSGTCAARARATIVPIVSDDTGVETRSATTSTNAVERATTVAAKASSVPSARITRSRSRSTPACAAASGSNDDEASSHAISPPALCADPTSDSATVSAPEDAAPTRANGSPAAIPPSVSASSDAIPNGSF